MIGALLRVNGILAAELLSDVHREPVLALESEAEKHALMGLGKVTNSGVQSVLTRDQEGNLVEQWGTFNSVWRLNDDGEWRVVFDAGNEAASEPDEATRALLDADTGCP